MALIVIMIHVKPNTHSDFMTSLFAHFISIAVPIFFISSILLFKKLNNRGYADMFKYCKRLGILYICWLVIDCYFIIVR